MQIEHIAVWTKNPEKTKNFYIKFFNATTNNKYSNLEGFSSYFLTFQNGARLEIMHKNPESDKYEEKKEEIFSGYSHFAFAVGSKEKVNKLTEKLRGHNYQIVSEPRLTGDGYYESCVLDPDGNRIEITI